MSPFKKQAIASCPFCNSAWFTYYPVVARTPNGQYYALCKNCSTPSIGGRTYRKAVNNWNKRLFNENVIQNEEEK